MVAGLIIIGVQCILLLIYLRERRWREEVTQHAWMIHRVALRVTEIAPLPVPVKVDLRQVVVDLGQHLIKHGLPEWRPGRKA